MIELFDIATTVGTGGRRWRNVKAAIESAGPDVETSDACKRFREKGKRREVENFGGLSGLLLRSVGLRHSKRLFTSSRQFRTSDLSLGNL